MAWIVVASIQALAVESSFSLCLCQSFSGLHNWRRVSLGEIGASRERSSSSYRSRIHPEGCRRPRHQVKIRHICHAMTLAEIGSALQAIPGEWALIAKSAGI